MFKMIVLILVVVLLPPMVVGAAGVREAAAPLQEHRLRYAHSNVPIYFYHTAGEAMAQELNKLTNGRIRVELFHGGQLGGERDVTEGLQLGTIDLQATSIGVTGTFIPAVRILNLPFIFLGPKHFEAVMNGPIGQELLAKAREQGEQVGLKVLSIAAPDFRIPMNDIRPIRRPEDFRGVRMRTMEVPVHMAAYRALGASPVPIPFRELYVALQTGVVDGNENGPVALYGNKFHEVQKYVSLLPVVSNAGILLMSKTTWDKLSGEDQKALMTSVDVWTRVMNRDAIEVGRWALGQMRTAGIGINVVDDVTPFVERVRPVYPAFFAELPEDLRGWAETMVTRIQGAAKGIVEGDWFAAR